MISSFPVILCVLWASAVQVFEALKTPRWDERRLVFIFSCGIIPLVQTLGLDRSEVKPLEKRASAKVKERGTRRMVASGE